MRAMKDSGVEWIGEIPADWEVRPLKSLGVYRNGLTYAPENIVDAGSGTLVLRSSNIQNGKIELKDNVFVAQEIPEQLRVKAGDILICSRNGSRDLIGKNAIIPSGIDASFGAFMMIFRSEFPRYMYYVLNSTIFNYYLGMFLTATINQLTGKNFGDMETVFCPDAAERQKIVNYLDEQCGEIDKVLAKTRESIEEYKKLKQSVITEAVTKGIRPDRPMKPSGIEWIGDIPEGWEVRPFRTILTERNEKNLPAKTEERLSLSIDLGVTKYAEKTTNLDRFKEDVTQYKLAYPGDLVMNSMNMIVGAVGVSPYFGCVSPAYYTYYDKSSSGVAARFCDFLFRTRIMRRVLRSLGKGIYSIERGDDRVNTCRLKVAREDLRALKIPLPSETEQTEIVAYLDQQCAEIDRLIAKKEQIITELESYKKSLIYECVTGKREVAG